MAGYGSEDRLGEGPVHFVTDSSGERFGAVVSDLGDGHELRLEDGRTLRVPTGLLEATAEGEYRLHESFAALSSGEYSEATYGFADATDMDDRLDSTGLDSDRLDGGGLDSGVDDRSDYGSVVRGADELESAVVPVVAESLNVSKRQLERGRVVVHKRVVTQQTTVDELLKDEQVEINRVPVNKIVEAAEPNRSDGDTLIIPLYEEVLVVEKRLVLIEELHITKRVREHRDPQQVTLRREEVDIERQSGEDDVM